MAQKIDWTKPAINDLGNIIEYYFPFSEEYSNHLYFKIIHNVNYIAENPLLGNISSYKDLRSKIVLKRYNIVYKYDHKKGKIIIYRIWDNRRNPKNKFKNL